MQVKGGGKNPLQLVGLWRPEAVNIGTAFTLAAFAGFMCDNTSQSFCTCECMFV